MCINRSRSIDIIMFLSKVEGSICVMMNTSSTGKSCRVFSPAHFISGRKLSALFTNPYLRKCLVKSIYKCRNCFWIISDWNLNTSNILSGKLVRTSEEYDKDFYIQCLPYTLCCFHQAVQIWADAHLNPYLTKVTHFFYWLH